MKDDKVLIAGIIGVISTIPCEILLQLLISLRFAKYSEFGQSSLLITGNRPSLIIGFFVSSLIAGFISILLYLTFSKLGSEHLVIKCVGASMFMWVVIEFAFVIYFEGKLIPIRQISGYYCHLYGAVIFGITQGILFRKCLFYKHIKSENIKSEHIREQPIADKPIKIQIIDERNMEKEHIDDKALTTEDKHPDDKEVYDLDKLLK